MVVWNVRKKFCEGAEIVFSLFFEFLNVFYSLNHGARCIFYPGETFLGLFHGGFIGQFDVLVSSIPAKVR